MAASLTIPQITLQVGSRTFGPRAIPGQVLGAVLVLTRDGVGGMNALTSDSVLDLQIQTSLDGGATFGPDVEGTFVGGIILDKFSNPYLNNTLSVNGLGPATHMQVVATVTGPSAIVISGSLTAT